MRPNEQHLCKIPAKTFLLGEYLALTGQQALIATFSPMFSLARTTSDFETSQFHPLSPAGRLLTENAIPVSWIDPFEGAGGFGASSAQYLGVLALQAGVLPRPDEALKAYLRLSEHQKGLRPSGADVLAQLIGGLALVGSSPLRFESMPKQIPNLLILSATGIKDQKTATHDHLEELGHRGFPNAFQPLVSELRDLTERGISALHRDDWAELGTCFNAYGLALRLAGLEAQATSRVCDAFRSLDFILGAKGCGAMQSDSIVVLVKPDADLDVAVRFGEQQGLRCVVKGFLPSQGASFS